MKLKSLATGALLALTLTLLAACGDSPTATPVPQINQVAFSAFDYGFSGPETIPAGMTNITLTNDGEDIHHQQLAKLPAGMTADDLIAAFSSGEEGPPPPGVVPAGGVAVLGPGVTGSVALNLEPGNYELVCFVADPNGVPHFALGMAQALTVTEATGPLAAEPTADLSIDMVDFGFDLSAPIAAGTQTIRIVNSGLQDHEAFLVQLAPDATAEDFLAAFEPGAPPGPPPGLPMGGLQAIAPGGRATIAADFTPGNYAFICFVDDEETGAPHFALGMLSEFQVQ